MTVIRGLRIWIRVGDRVRKLLSVLMTSSMSVSTPICSAVEYSMYLSAYRRSLSVAAGVLCALSVLHALLAPLPAPSSLPSSVAPRPPQVTFSVEYSMDLSAYRRSLSVAAGVLCALAILHALLRTWGWSKRAGKVAIDIVTIVKFIVFVCAGIANVFFVVCAGVALWWLIFYKVSGGSYIS